MVNEKKYIKAGDLMRLTLPPMAFLFVCLLAMIAISFLSEKTKSNKELNTHISKVIDKQSYNFMEEVYLQQTDAVELRMGFILDELQSQLRGQQACLEVVLNQRNGIEKKSIFKCSSNAAENKLETILTKTVPLNLGKEEIGVIKYGIGKLNLVEATIALKYLAATVFAFIMALGFLYIFTVRVRNKIVKPLLQRIQQSAKDEVTVEIAKQVAHDIRSPLSAISMVANLSTKLPEDHKKLMLSASERIQSMANELLEKSKDPKSKEINLAKPAIKRAQNISKNIEELLLEKKVSNTYKKVTIKHEFDSNTQINCKSTDLLELKRIVSNIINNSIEAIDEKGTVKVKTIKSRKSVQIQIIDNGSGIPDEILGRIGEKGFSYGKTEGNGLGLYYAINKVESWGGGIDIKSTTNLGTTVTITLPEILLQNQKPMPKLEEAASTELFH